jgi:amino acid transporter
LTGDAALIRAVGFFALTAAVINVIVGGGIFRLPSALGAILGPAAPIAFLLGAGAIIPIAPLPLPAVMSTPHSVRLPGHIAASLSSVSTPLV